MQQTTNTIKNMEDYPLMLTADHISEILHMSKRRAYEVMELKSFPTIRIGKRKWVQREAFFAWLKQQEGASA